VLIRTMEQIEAEGRVISIGYGKATAVRLLTKADGLNFSISEARGSKAGASTLWYKNHWEGNLVLEGSLEVTDKTTGEAHLLGPGGLYLVGPGDPHHLKTLTDVHAISVFDPPLTGKEDHDADGAYPPTGSLPPGPGAV